MRRVAARAILIALAFATWAVPTFDALAATAKSNQAQHSEHIEQQRHLVRFAARKFVNVKAKVSFSDCVKKLALQDGGWCQMAGAAIANVFPKDLPPNIRGWNGPRSVISTWNGAAWDSKRRKWYFFGGGHTDYGGNEVYEFDLKTAIFTRLTDPSPIPEATTENKCPEPVSGPRSQHTYDGIIFSSATDTIWVFPGATGYCFGGIVNLGGKVWEFNPDRTRIRNGIPPLHWRLSPIRMPPQLRTFLRSAELPDGRIFVVSSLQSAFFDPRTGQWTLSTTRANWGDGNMIYDQARGVFWECNYAAFIAEKAGAPVVSRMSGLVYGVTNASGLAIDGEGGNYVYAWNGSVDVDRWDIEHHKWYVSKNMVGPRGQRPYSKFIWLEPEKVFLAYSDPFEGVWVYKPPQKGWLELALTTAQSYIDTAPVGGHIKIPSGIYSAGIFIKKPLTISLRGVIFGSPVGGKGYIVVETTGPVTIEGYDMPGPHCGSNCAAVRADGAFDVTVLNSHIYDADEGILTGNNGGKLSVENTLIENIVGGEAGQTHGVYFGRGDTFTIRNSTVRDVRTRGHLLKSRALKTVIDSVRLLGLNGHYSRELDLPCGGDITVKNSVLEKGPNSENNDSIAVGTEPQFCGNRATRPTSFKFINNWLIFDRGTTAESGPNYFGNWRVALGSSLDVAGNRIVNMTGGWHEFPNLSARNKLYRDRASAGIGPRSIPAIADNGSTSR